jgi:NAD dependent epimerase/dehydratase family enzyme
MVMSPGRGGAFHHLRLITRLGLGGPVAGGAQFMSWIHGQDFVRALQFLLDHDDLTGPINLASPNPLPLKDFMRTLRKTQGIPIGLPATKWMAKIGAFIVRTDTELLLKSRRVIPGRLLNAGFTFNFPTWPQAAADLQHQSTHPNPSAKQERDRK